MASYRVESHRVRTAFGPQVQEEPWIPIMYAAWAFTEVVRYPWYAFTLLGICPGWLTWLRCAPPPPFLPTLQMGSFQTFQTPPSPPLETGSGRHRCHRKAPASYTATVRAAARCGASLAFPPTSPRVACQAHSWSIEAAWRRWLRNAGGCKGVTLRAYASVCAMFARRG